MSSAVITSPDPEGCGARVPDGLLEQAVSNIRMKRTGRMLDWFMHTPGK
jgi:hypothetical protein